MAAPRYLIAEDEPLLADALARQLARVWPEAECARIANNGNEALDAANAEPLDVVFLDVRMPGASGLDAARVLCTRPEPPLIVFVTAYDEYAVGAFEAAAVDYLLKPVETDRLAHCVARLKRRLEDPSASAAALADRLESLLAERHGERLRVIRAGSGATVRLIPVEEVRWFEAADKYVTVATAHGDALIRTSLRELMAQLDPHVFWRIHRNRIVNSRHVEAARRDDTGRLEVILRGRPERLPVSRTYAHQFRQM